MKKIIYKVTSKRILKMIENVDYLDCKDKIIDLSNQFIVPLKCFNDLLVCNKEFVIFTYDKSITQVYQLIIKVREKGA